MLALNAFLQNFKLLEGFAGQGVLVANSVLNIIVKTRWRSTMVQCGHFQWHVDGRRPVYGTFTGSIDWMVLHDATAEHANVVMNAGLKSILMSLGWQSTRTACQTFVHRSLVIVVLERHLGWVYCVLMLLRQRYGNIAVRPLIDIRFAHIIHLFF